jgi:RES domain
VNARGVRAVCSYCNKQLPTITLGEMAVRLDAVFDEHYMLLYMGNLSEEGCAMLNEVHERFGWDTKRTRPTEIICSLANIPAEPAEHLRLIIDASRRADDERGPPSLAEDDEYVRIAPDNRKLNELWDRCERSFTTEVRHFNRRAESVLYSIFDGLTQYTTRDGKSAVIEAGPDAPLTSLFRARYFDSEAELTTALMYPEENLGPPPKSSLPGRMSATGMSVFYGATRQKITIAEVQPPVGSRVLVGRFDLVRRVCLLDLEALRSVYVDGSLLDPAYNDRLRKAVFLERLSQRMTQPVTPDDAPSGYIITQVIADYLADREPAIDGILYPSVQASSGGYNVVLFHKSARVDIPFTSMRTRFQVHLRNLNDKDSRYGVLATVPFLAPPSREYEEEAEGLYPEPHSDLREVTLRLDRRSLAIFHIDGTTIDPLSWPVEITRVDEPVP